MTIKDELHELIDGLEEARARELLVLLRGLLHANGSVSPRDKANEPEREGPLVVAGREFFSQQPRTLRQLAEEQGVKPIQSVDDLKADFWPDDESVEDFVNTIRAWRHERDV